MLLKGLRYKIGNEFQVRSGLDPWILGHDEFRPIGFIGQPSLPVSTFILDTMEWNMDLLQDNFAQIDIDHIVTILLSFYQSQDRLIWHHNTSGVYSVKSSFHLANSISEKLQESSSDDFKSWWKFFWALQLPPKNHTAFDLDQQLSTHLLGTTFDQISRTGLDATNKDSSSQQLQPWQYLDTLQQLAQHHNLTINHESHNMAARYTIHHDASNHNLNSCHVANQQQLPLTSELHNYGILQQNVTSDDGRQKNKIAWMPPKGNLLKMNIDVAANFHDKILGIGAVVRNNKGEVIAAFSKRVQGCFRSDEMEAKALFHSLNWATQQQLLITHVETDALRVSSALNSPHGDVSCYSDLIVDVRCLLFSFPGVTVTYARRQANQAAHSLAKYALKWMKMYLG
uniref:RNase H type-1 domain-containing protein n=1 Tax=Cannabis sativa TaxID=3483 RepID=A0A803PK25_CANSA